MRSAVSRRNGPAPVDNLVDAARRRADCLGQTVLADPQFVEDLRQVFAGMNQIDTRHGFPLNDNP